MIFVLIKYGFQSSGVPKREFKRLGIGTAFIGFWVNAVGFSTALFLDVNQHCILQFPQSIHCLWPSTVEQPHHLTDGIVQVNAPVFVRPAVFPGQACPAQDNGVQQICFIGQRLIDWCYKQEVGEPGETLFPFLLVMIDKLCHSILWIIRSSILRANDKEYHLPRFGVQKAP